MHSSRSALNVVLKIETKLGKTSKKAFNGMIMMSTTLFCCAQTDFECQGMSMSKYTPYI